MVLPASPAGEAASATVVAATPTDDESQAQAAEQRCALSAAGSPSHVEPQAEEQQPDEHNEEDYPDEQTGGKP